MAVEIQVESIAGLLSMPAVARMLHISENTLRHRIAARPVPIVRLGRQMFLRLDDVATYLSSRQG
jgi:hypothetical protein